MMKFFIVQSQAVSITDLLYINISFICLFIETYKVVSIHFLNSCLFKKQ